MNLRRKNNEGDKNKNEGKEDNDSYESDQHFWDYVKLVKTKFYNNILVVTKEQAVHGSIKIMKALGPDKKLQKLFHAYLTHR